MDGRANVRGPVLAACVGQLVLCGLQCAGLAGCTRGPSAWVGLALVFIVDDALTWRRLAELETETRGGGE